MAKLLELCFKCAYFSFQDQYYLQIYGAAMGSPVLLYLYMEDFERRVLESAVHPPRWWKQCVDGIHTVLVKIHAQEFTDHLKSIDDDIKWTT